MLQSNTHIYHWYVSYNHATVENNSAYPGTNLYQNKFLLLKVISYNVAKMNHIHKIRPL